MRKTLRVRLAPLAELGAESTLDYEVLDALGEFWTAGPCVDPDAEQP